MLGDLILLESISSVGTVKCITQWLAQERSDPSFAHNSWRSRRHSHRLLARTHLAWQGARRIDLKRSHFLRNDAARLCGVRWPASSSAAICVQQSDKLEWVYNHIAQPLLGALGPTYPEGFLRAG